jgi:two-component sensor histidine kinase
MGVSGFYGVLEVDRREAHEFDALDTSFLAGIAGILADAVERVRRFATLQAAHDARDALLREHHHRVRNSYQALIARVQRHAAQVTTENSRRRMQDIERRVFALASLYDHLVGLGLSGDRLDLAHYLGDLCERMRAFHDIQERAIELVCGCGEASISYDLDTCTALGIAVNELVANAIEHAFGRAGGRIEVRLERGADGALLTVADNGSGFHGVPPESIGLAGVERLVASIGATMTRSHPDTGTVWTIALPAGGELTSSVPPPHPGPLRPQGAEREGPAKREQLCLSMAWHGSRSDCRGSWR